MAGSIPLWQNDTSSGIPSGMTGCQPQGANAAALHAPFKPTGMLPNGSRADWPARLGSRLPSPQAGGGLTPGRAGEGCGGWGEAAPYQSVWGSSMTKSSLNFLAAAEDAEPESTKPAEAAVCFTALERELKKLLPTDCCGCWGGGAAAGCGCRRSEAGEGEDGAAEEAGGGGGC